MANQCSGISLKNEIKDNIKVISSLENRGILLKWTIKKATRQIGGLLNFFGPLTKIGLPLMKNHTFRILVSLGLN